MKGKKICLDIQLLKKRILGSISIKSMVLDLSLRLKSIISPKNKFKSMLNQVPSIYLNVHHLK